MKDEQIREVISCLTETEAKQLLHNCFWIIQGELGAFKSPQDVIKFIRAENRED